MGVHRSTEYEINAVTRVGKDVVIAGTSSGEVFISRFPSIDDAKLTRIRAHSAAVSAVCFMPAGAVGGETVFTAGGRELTIFCWRLRRLKTEVYTDSLSVMSSQHAEGIRLLLGLLPCYGVSARASAQASFSHASEPWRTSMLRPPLDLFLSADVIGGWGSSFARMALKDLDLQLERVHGYRGHDCRGNVLSGKDGLIVWFVGRVVVLSGERAKQRFYLQHADDVACIAKFEPIARADHADAGFDLEVPVLMATAEVGDVGEVHVWDTVALTCIAKLIHAFPVRQLSFGPEGKMLLCAGGLDDSRTLTVWDWADEVQLAHLTCDHNVPFLDVKCNHFFERSDGERDQVWASTCGPHGVTFWTLHNPAAGERCKLIIEEGVLHHISDQLPDPMAICCHFVSSSVLVTGLFDTEDADGRYCAIDIS